MTTADPVPNRDRTADWHAWVHAQVAAWNRHLASTPRNEGSNEGVVPDPTRDTSGAEFRSPTSHFRRSCRSVGATLRQLSPHLRHKVVAAYRASGGQRRPLNDRLRTLLSEALFQVENDLEHRQPHHPQVCRLRDARHRLYDDLGWNEYPTHRQES